MNKAIFLDRDGTINIEKNYLYKIEDFEFIPGVFEALRMLQGAGFKLIIITNQSGIGRGYYTEKDFEVLNTWMIKELSKHDIIIDAVYYCPHHPNAIVDKFRLDCDCRKPKVGMFYRAIEEYNLDISECYAIGDRIRDCMICSTTKCKGILVNNFNEQERGIQYSDTNMKIMRVKSLLDAANYILE